MVYSEDDRSLLRPSVHPSVLKTHLAPAQITDRGIRKLSLLFLSDLSIWTVEKADVEM